MRILLVEDIPDDALLTVRGLQKLEFPVEIVVAGDGVEAIQVLFGPGAQLPDLVLLDLSLPKLSGLGVLRRIRSERTAKNLPVVILTSSDDDRDQIACYEAGATRYLKKGLHLDDLVGELRSIVNFPIGQA